MRKKSNGHYLIISLIFLITVSMFLIVGCNGASFKTLIDQAEGSGNGGE